MVNLPPECAGLALCKIVGQELRRTEPVVFSGGRADVDTILRRAQISGKVGPVGETGDFWADVLSADLDLIETVALDRSSWNVLKNRWMRCRMEGR
jgi:hypothetical protein